MARQPTWSARRQPRRQRWLEAPSRLVAASPGRWLCLGAWLALAAAALPFALRVGSAESNDLLSLLPSKVASTQVLRLERLFPSGRHLEAVVVFRRAGGLTGADRARIYAVVARVSRLREPGLGQPSGVVVSPDGTEALFVVPVAANQRDLVEAVGKLQALARIPGGPEAEVTGTAGFNADLFSAFSGVDLKLLVATVALVVVLLLLTYQSPFLWLVPLAAVVLAVVVADAAVFGLSKVGVTLTGENVGLLTVVVFGAGTDYALLITARYREELRTTTDRTHAMAVALSRATPSIVASATTVGAALLCLLAASFGVSRSFGIVGAVGVGAALATMLSAYPALLVACSRRVFWPRIPLVGTEDASRAGPWAVVARSLAVRPGRFAGLAIGALVVMSLGLFKMDTSLTALDDLPSSSSAAKGAHLLAKSFPPGQLAPVDVVVTDVSRLGAVRSALARDPAVSQVGPAEYADHMAHFSVLVNSLPSGQRAFELIDRLRAVVARASGGAALVGGQTAQDLDLARATSHDERRVIPLVLGVVVLVLVGLLRGLLGPLVVTLTVVGTFAAALGVCAAVFGSLLGYPGVDPTVPLLGFVFLVALGTDYNVFLLGRVSQEIDARGLPSGVVVGLSATGGVLTSAGLILAGTFAVLTILPLLPSKEIGLVVAFGVLLDTLVVRTVLVPCLALVLGRAFWWPRQVAAAA